MHHNHTPDPVDIEVRSCVNKIKKAANREHEITSNVVKPNIEAVFQQASTKLPSTSSFYRIVERIRSNKLMVIENQHNLVTMILTEVYTRNIQSELFLLCDTNNGKPRMLIFSTKKDLQKLKSCNIWAADGNFSCVPDIFVKLYTIHGLFDDKCVPLVYCLYPNKNNKHIRLH